MDPLEPVTRRLESASRDETFTLGERLGRALEPRDFVGLDGPLGAGKTAFCRGVASGAGVPLEEVSSPTYSIVQTYQGRLTLHHADLYRLVSEGDLFATGYFDLLDSDGAMLVEWVSQVPGAAPEDALLLRFGVVDADRRSLQVTARGDRAGALLERWLGPAPVR
ncbi:MAG: tRNA (adenosine(37)-N6)-threonylcarbamoyltransferase complex ATPase subunit type 1 TsaE [Myxococcaceae bacterium]|nr:tRNA (adenosine(37)-N6)-threonylcarbamoyltransferase complex ATPase subunit type 1 TsaE [Myxococcaceae bacterium]